MELSWYDVSRLSDDERATLLKLQDETNLRKKLRERRGELLTLLGTHERVLDASMREARSSATPSSSRSPQYEAELRMLKEEAESIQREIDLAVESLRILSTKGAPTWMLSPTKTVGGAPSSSLQASPLQSKRSASFGTGSAMKALQEEDDAYEQSGERIRILREQITVETSKIKELQAEVGRLDDHEVNLATEHIRQLSLLEAQKIDLQGKKRSVELMLETVLQEVKRRKA
jgi:hypothetical protein